MDETILRADERINVQQYKEILDKGENHLLIDVRPKIQFGICSLPNSIHIPIEELEKKLDQVKQVKQEKKVKDENGKYFCSKIFYWF